MSATPPDRLDPADIPVVIIAGGQGMRLREETERVPKPMVRLGERPIMWHIMKHYATYGFRRFTVCLGYKGWVIKEYFLNYVEKGGDLRLDLARGRQQVLSSTRVEDWEVTLVETGIDSGSTGRLQGAARYIDTPYFMYTYGDGVGDVDLDAVHDTFLSTGSLATVTGVKPGDRYGVLSHDEERVTSFTEKPQMAEGYVSGGFWCLSADVLDLLADADPGEFFEIDLLPSLVAEGRVSINRHHGWWHSMDTYRDFTHLNELWARGEAPWKTWE